jgi:hypothetical protein
LRVGYAKLGQRVRLDAARDWSSIGSDRDEPTVLAELARRNPDWELVLVGMNTGENPTELGFPPNVTNPWSNGLRDEVKIRLAAIRKQHVNGTGLTIEGRYAVISMYDELTAPLFHELDACVVWAGTHGTSNSPMPGITPKTRGRYTFPQDQYVTYGSYLLRGLSVWREPDPLKREEIWLVPDVRNVLKFHDEKWPRRREILGQFGLEYRSICCRYGDPREPDECGFEAEWHSERNYWTATDRYVGSGLEICGVHPDTDDEGGRPFADRRRFGLFINEADPRAKLSRRVALRDWVLPLGPDFVHGNWTAESQRTLGMTIEPAPSRDYYALLGSVRSTFTTPSSGSGWATAKPWEAFAVNAVCFIHPNYDTQGHIIPTLDQVQNGEVADENLCHLARWLRVETPEQLAQRVRAVDESEETWRWLSALQFNIYQEAQRDPRYLRTIEERVKEQL